MSIIVSPAIVLKNNVKTKNSLVLLHKQLGKIICVYKSRTIASRLSVGMFITCYVQKKKSYYQIDEIDILFAPVSVTLDQLTFIHRIIRLAETLLPYNIVVHELFDFILYVYQHLDQFNQAGRGIVMLRIFMLFDLLPNDKKIYSYARRNPIEFQNSNPIDLQQYVRVCWNDFEAEHSS